MMLTIRARVTTTSVEATSQSRCVGMLIASAIRETCCTRSQLLMAQMHRIATLLGTSAFGGRSAVGGLPVDR
jgi:hypothetical protein